MMARSCARATCAKAEVQSTAAETDMKVGVAAQVHTVRMIERLRVPVAGRIENHHLLPLHDGLTAQLEVP